MPLQIHLRNCDWFRTAGLFHHASVPRWYRYLPHRQIFLFLSSVRGQPVWQGTLHRNLHTDSASGWYVPVPPLRLHAPYAPPATGILWNAETDGFPFPSVLRNTTGCTPLADHGKTGSDFYKNRRTVSQK